MIASVRGRILEMGNNEVVILVGGIGLRIGVPKSVTTSYVIEDNILLHTFLVVREDNLSLFGFEHKEQLEIFQELLRVNGVGPRLALVIISTLSVNQIYQAVAGEQVHIFNQVPGIGTKTAQKIIFQLHDRMKSISDSGGLSRIQDPNSELMDALTALGYSVIESQTAIQSIPKDAPVELEERIRLALQYFSS